MNRPGRSASQHTRPSRPSNVVVKARSESVCESPAQTCKLFIGGLSYDTTDESLQRYFEGYGEVETAVVLRDPSTLRSRGFGFVTFTAVQSANEVVSHTRHLIDGRKVEAKFAVPRSATLASGSIVGVSTTSSNPVVPSSPSGNSTTPTSASGGASAPTSGNKANKTVSGPRKARGASKDGQQTPTASNGDAGKQQMMGSTAVSSNSPSSSLRSSSATSFSSASTAASLPYSAALAGSSSNNGAPNFASVAAIGTSAASQPMTSPRNHRSTTNASGSGDVPESLSVRSDSFASDDLSRVHIPGSIGSHGSVLEDHFVNKSSSSEGFVSEDQYQQQQSQPVRKSRTASTASNSPAGGKTSPKNLASPKAVTSVIDMDGNVVRLKVGSKNLSGGIISNKIFVGGLLYATGHESLRGFFESYGPVDTAEVIYNRDTKKSRGFGFVVFQNHESVSKVLEDQDDKMHVIDGKQVEVKRCVARQESSKSMDGALMSPSIKSPRPNHSQAKPARRSQSVIEEEKDQLSLSSGKSNTPTNNQWSKKSPSITFAAVAAGSGSSGSAALNHAASTVNASEDDSPSEDSAISHQQHKGQSVGVDLDSHDFNDLDYPSMTASGAESLAFERDEDQPGSMMHGQQQPPLSVMPPSNHQLFGRYDSHESMDELARDDRFHSPSQRHHHSFTRSQSGEEFYMEDQFNDDDYSSFRNERTGSSSSSSSNYYQYQTPSSPLHQSPFQQNAFSPRHGEHAPSFMSLTSPVALEGRGSPLPTLSLDTLSKAAMGSPSIRAASPGPVADTTGIWGSSSLTSPSRAGSVPNAAAVGNGAFSFEAIGSPRQHHSHSVHVDAFSSMNLNDSMHSPVSSQSTGQQRFQSHPQHHHHHQQQQQSSQDSGLEPMRSPIKISHPHNLSTHSTTVHPLASPMSTASAPAFGTGNSEYMFSMNFATTPSHHQQHQGYQGYHGGVQHQHQNYTFDEFE